MKHNRIILSLFVGIIALTSITLSVSLAWYASSSTGYVEAIRMNLDTERDLKIAIQADGDYKEEIKYSDIAGVSTFIPVTSAYHKNWMDEKSEVPYFYDDSRYSSSYALPDRRPLDYGYFSQEFYLKSDDDIYVTINPDKTYINPNEEYNKTYAKELYDKAQASTKPSEQYLKNLTEEDFLHRLNELVKAMRFSILIPSSEDYGYGIIDPNKVEDTVLGGLLDNDIDHYFDYFHYENDTTYYERVYGEIIGDKNNIVYDEPLSHDSELKDGPGSETSAFNAKHKAGVRLFNLEKSQENGVSFQVENSYSLSDFTKEKKPFHFPVYRDHPQKIIVSIYIEGWDLDSVNYTMGATFLASLALKIEREM